MDLKYKKNSVGSIMTTSVPACPPNLKTSEVLKLLKEKNFSSINYIYVVDENSKLIGVCSIKELLKASDEAVMNFINEKFISAHVDEEKEQIAYKALKHNLKAIPVINDNGIFLGAVTSDVIMKILDTKAIENTLRLGGVYVHKDHKLDGEIHETLRESILHRLPWLFVGLVGGIITAGLIKGFEEILSQNLILASFIPMIVYMGDAVGTQMEAFIIRDLSKDKNLNFFHYITKQFIIVITIGIILALILMIFSMITHKHYGVSIVLGISLLTAVLSSVITGLLIPYIFEKLKFDPANASGPIATVIQDFLSILIFLSVATLIL